MVTSMRDEPPKIEMPDDTELCDFCKMEVKRSEITVEGVRLMCKRCIDMLVNEE